MPENSAPLVKSLYTHVQLYSYLSVKGVSMGLCTNNPKVPYLKCTKPLEDIAI